MNRNWYGNAVQTLLLAAVVFFGVMIVNALDRVHAALRDLSGSGIPVIAREAAAAPEAKTEPAADVANRE